MENKNWQERFDDSFGTHSEKGIWINREDAKKFLKSEKDRAREEERTRILKKVEDYLVPKTAVKVNKLGADYIFVYDLKKFCINPNNQ